MKDVPLTLDKVSELKYVPQYPDVKTYVNVFGNLFQWEADDWQSASLSWKESCYIHAGISGAEVTIKGPDAQALVSMSAINDCYKWRLNFGKHLVMCDENGLISSHALVNRTAEDTFVMSAGNPWPWLKLLNTGKYQAEPIFGDIYVFQCAGPKSLTCIEDFLQADLHDLKCLETRTITVPGLGIETLVQRIGMSGTLSYELRGPAQDGPAVYDAFYQVGKARYDMKRLGWRTYFVNHTEGGYPQTSCSFSQACDIDPDFIASGMNLLPPVYTGSYDPANARARLRTPGEVGWSWMAKFDHDFVGRAAVEAEAAAPKRTIVTLEWNDEDVADIYNSQFRYGEPYKYMELPCSPQQPAGGNADRVLSKEGREIGVASASVYSKYFRKFICQCTIDVDQADIGNEVVLEWGDFGGIIKKVRARVERYPYLDLVRNEKYDMDTVPHGFKK
jgi:glycine cleavage system aminomethyltransferase T